jgi:hypothetical protein
MRRLLCVVCGETLTQERIEHCIEAVKPEWRGTFTPRTCSRKCSNANFKQRLQQRTALVDSDAGVALDMH